jgi:hypothetical protein
MAELRLVLLAKEKRALQWLAGVEGVDAPHVATLEALRAVECVNILRGDDDGGYATFSLTPKGAALADAAGKKGAK